MKLLTVSEFHWIRRYDYHRFRLHELLMQGHFPFRENPFKQNTPFIYPHGPMEVFLDMAGKKSGRKRFDTGDMEFINFRFSAKERDAFRKWLSEEQQKAVLAVKTTCQDDNKLGISWDNSNGVFIATLMGKEDSINAGKCLLIRSEDWDRALFACAYVHEVIFKSGVWEVDKDGDLA